MNSGDRAVYQGYEVCLWPLSYINITGTPQSANHIVNGVANSGLWDNGYLPPNQVMPLYAPCTIQLVASYNSGESSGHTQLWRSVDKVWIPSASEPVYISFAVGHSAQLYYTNIGDIVQQGMHFYDTGTYGYVTGSHVHMILSLDYRTSMYPVGVNPTYGNIWYSDNPPATIADMFYILDSDYRYNDGGLVWTEWTGTITHGITSLLAYIAKKRRVRHGKRITEII